MRDRAAVVLLILGLSQMAGDLLHVVPLRAVAAATCAAPAPKVFCAVRGLETYSTRFYLKWPGRTMRISPETYHRIRGPYNRRNVYGAAIAYAPVLPPTLRDAILRRSLCGDAPLLRDLGVDSGGPFTLTLEPLPGTTAPGLETRFEVRCR